MIPTPSPVRSTQRRALSRRSALWLPVATLMLLAVGAVASLSAVAQEAPSVKGDYVGVLSGRPVHLHISVTSDGKLRGRMDAEGKSGIPCADFRLEGDGLSFNCAIARGSWKGAVQNGGATLSGTWTTLGEPVPLVFMRQS
jgi:hypothetical protein